MAEDDPFKDAEVAALTTAATSARVVEAAASTVMQARMQRERDQDQAERDRAQARRDADRLADQDRRDEQQRDRDAAAQLRDVERRAEAERRAARDADRDAEREARLAGPEAFETWKAERVGVGAEQVTLADQVDVDTDHAVGLFTEPTAEPGPEAAAVAGAEVDVERASVRQLITTAPELGR